VADLVIIGAGLAVFLAALVFIGSQARREHGLLFRRWRRRRGR
jgi:hypothetical protein